MISYAKKRLLKFERDGKFLFHGSPFLVEELILKQPFNSNKKDGNPCVSATELAEVAIFRAITHEANFSGGGCDSSFGYIPGGRIYFTVTRELLEQLNGKMGYVYVLPWKECFRVSPIELRFEQNIRPIEVITVSAEDLPNDIKVR